MRKRYRELGFSIGTLPPGDKNCITDVPGVIVGHENLEYEMNSDYICTGVTSILPHSNNIFQNKVISTSYVFNGFGKIIGLVQLNELGRLESPIMLTNTFSVPAVAQGTLEYLLKENHDIGETAGTANVVVGECNDSYLNSIRKFPILPLHVVNAIKKASSDKVTEGNVGAGKGMVCFGFKGGIGTSSRVVKSTQTTYKVGCLVLTNFGKKEDLLSQDNFIKQRESKNSLDESLQSDGSIIIILATNAPVNERQLNRISKRCGIGLGRTGSYMVNGSGDIVIAFSNAYTFPHHSKSSMETTHLLRDDSPEMSELFKSATEVTHEAILNSLTTAYTTKGRKQRVVEAIPYNLLSNI